MDEKAEASRWSVSLDFHREVVARLEAEIDRLKARNAHLEGLIATDGLP